MVVSTICLHCRESLQIEDDRVIQRPYFGTQLASKRAEDPFDTKLDKSISLLKQARFRPLFAKVFMKPVQHQISCYHCGNGYQVVRDAQSSQCPKCAGHISLKNYQIDHAWRRRIQTRGDIVIQKHGSIVGVDVCCHGLLVLGELSASVNCSGDLIIRRHGTILGNMKCRELRIERNAEVKFHGEIHAQRVYIDGEVTAQITCTGTITLAKKAHLKGLVKARGLIVKAGARHTGSMEVLQSAAVVLPHD